MFIINAFHVSPESFEPWSPVVKVEEINQKL